jgi:small subunit ribosomal protein S1
VLVQFGNLQGFIPRSHIVSASGRQREGDGVEALIGKEVPVKVIEVSRRKRRLIMSERQAIREWRATQKSKLLEDLQEGETRTGKVSSIADFGAFVDLGGADGLVHVSEMTYERGRHPRDIVTVGQEVEVHVLSIDRERSRIGLSMKRLQSDPWERVDSDHYVGELVEASISNLTKFGAFARLDDGLEGLIHISELADEHVEHPRDAVRMGQRVTVEIISIDSARQRIGLSIRRVPAHLRIVDDAPPVEDGEEVVTGEDQVEGVEENATVDGAAVEGNETSDAVEASEEVGDAEVADDGDDDDTDDGDGDDTDDDDDADDDADDGNDDADDGDDDNAADDDDGSEDEN